MSSQESDRSIVVRDGRAVHMAKGWTRRQGDQSTCAEGKKVPPRSVSSSLIALRQKGVARAGLPVPRLVYDDKSANAAGELWNAQAGCRLWRGQG